jgi:hypothetical protein
VNPLTLQPTFFAAPKQVVLVTLRLVGRLDAAFAAQLGRRAGLIVRSQPDVSAIDQSNDDEDGAVDVVPPVLNLSGVSALASVEGNAPGGANVSVVVTATDESGPATVACTRTGPAGSAPLSVDGSTSFVPLGSWTATCVASDQAGNQTTAGFPVAVVDTVQPSISTPPPNQVEVQATSSSGAVVTFPTAASDVVDSSPAVVCVPPSGSVFPVGVTTVQCTATDASGNASTRSFTVTVTGVVTTTIVAAGNAVYDGLPHGASASVTGDGGLNQNVPVVYAGVNGTLYGPVAAAPVNAGTYTATASFAGTGDYLASTGTATYTIARRAASVTPSPASKVFGAPDPPLNGTLAGFVAGDGIGATYTRAAGEAVGTYPISGALAPASALGNYTIGYATAPFTIVMPPPPTITATADPNLLLWSPNKTMTPVTVSGSAMGPGMTVSYTVADEYKKVQPSGTAVVNASGAYAVVLSLEAYRNGNDQDGRLYIITVTGRDQFGRTVVTTTTVRVPHDLQ